MKKCKLITVFDPLCGWCYGFGPVLNQLRERYSERLDFDILSGGMITGKAVGPLSNMADFISRAYPVVESTTGIKFGQAFLNNLKDGRAIFSSLEPSNVLTVMKELFPGDSLAASHEIQELIYHEGINPVDYEAYLPLFRKRGADEKMVLARLKSAETAQLSVLEFAEAAKWGIRGFPACIIETPQGKLYGIASGYLPAEELEIKIQPFLVQEDL